MRQQFVGLPALRNAADAQVHTAMAFVQESQRATQIGIEAMLVAE